MEDRGIVYIAIGEAYLAMAIRSAQSVIEVTDLCPPILIITDCFGDHIKLHNISILQVGINSQYLLRRNTRGFSSISYSAFLKTKLNYFSPFQKTLFLDCDILGRNDINSIWDAVGEGIGVTKAFYPILKGVDYSLIAEVDYTARLFEKYQNYSQYNTGMFLFESSYSSSLTFELWNKEWELFTESENMAFNRLVCKKNINPVEMRSKYNEFYPVANQDSCLVHYLSGYKRNLVN